MHESIVVMGVAGCGKSSLAAAIARSEKMPLIEGDDFHSVASREKMHAGVPLTDDDRKDWLETLGRKLQGAEGIVLTCSALKRRYRDGLRAASPGLRFLFLQIDREASMERVAGRGSAHFFSSKLVDSQFAALESPVGETGVITLDATLPIEQLQKQAAAELRGLDNRT